MVIDDVGRCRASMMRAAMFGLCLCGSLPAFAATLGDIAAALAAPAGAPQATNDWTAFAKLAGSKWQGKAPAKGGNKYYWNGTVPINGVGPGGISLVGDKAAVAVGHRQLAEGHQARHSARDARGAVSEGRETRTSPRRLPGRAAEWLTHLSRDTGRSQTALPAHPVRGSRPWWLHVDDRDGAPAQQAVDLLMDNVRVVRLGRRADARSSHRVLRPRALALTEMIEDRNGGRS